MNNANEDLNQSDTLVKSGTSQIPLGCVAELLITVLTHSARSGENWTEYKSPESLGDMVNQGCTPSGVKCTGRSMKFQQLQARKLTKAALKTLC